MSRQHTNFNWVLEPWKFLSEKQAKTLLAAAREGAALAATQGRKTPVRDYLIVDIGLSTGLRVMEIAQLNCGDIRSTVFGIRTHASCTGQVATI